MEVVRKANVWGSILVAIGFPESKSAMGVIVFKNREKDVKDSDPGEGAAYVSLPTAHFRIEVKSLKSLESIFKPAGEGVPSANNCVIVEVEEDEPIRKWFRHP